MSPHDGGADTADREFAHGERGPMGGAVWKHCILGVVAVTVLSLVGCGVSPAESDATEPRDVRPGIVCGLAMTGGHFVVCSRGRSLVLDR